MFLVTSLLFFFNIKPPSLLSLLSGLVYISTASFVICVEIPGYLILSRRDEDTVGRLRQIRQALIETRYSFDHVQKLKTQTEDSSSVLLELRLSDLLNEFINSCEHLNNVDRDFWGLVLSETTNAIKDVSNSSKHPIPRIVDFLSLAGLSFLIAQILKLLE